MKFGDNLRIIRKSKKISQEVLSEKIGVSRQSVSKWETGESYPEMNNILMLCKIFHCNINDLVNDNIVDLDSLDEEIKMNVVKFKKEKQKQMKGLSKAIYVIARIFKIVSIIGIVSAIILMLSTPVIVNNVKVENNNVTIFNESVKFESDSDIKDAQVVKDKVITVINNNSNGKLVFYGEFIVTSLIITLVFIYLILKYLEKIFMNINKNETPFTLENSNMIKKIAFNMIFINIFTNICGLLGQFMMKVNLNISIDLVDVMYILVILSIAFIFEYGYEIQLDSKGRIYGDENE